MMKPRTMLWLLTAASALAAGPLLEDGFQSLDPWHLEGRVEGVTVSNGVLRLDCTGSQQGGIGTMAFTKQDFPDNIIIEYDLVVEQTNGLLITFVAMQGTNGEDAITGVPRRSGAFDDYTGPNASTRSYHVSVCRYDDRGAHTGVSNWRRNPGLHRMASGKDLCTETGKTYHVAITKRGPRCEIRVNGELGAAFTDPQTLPGPIPTSGKIGFRAIGSKAIFRISNFKVTPAVTIKIDPGKTVGAMTPIWRFFGCDEPNYAYMKDGRKLLGELGTLAPQRVFFCTHNLLTSGDGTPALKWGSTAVYSEDADGRPIYNWTILDRIFDAYH